jgi:hypothetical protein
MNLNILFYQEKALRVRQVFGCTRSCFIAVAYRIESGVRVGALNSSENRFETQVAFYSDISQDFVTLKKNLK